MSRSLNSPFNTFLLTLVGGFVLVAVILVWSSRGDKNKTLSSAETDDITNRAPVVADRVARDEVYTNTNKDGPIKVTINLGGLTNTIEAE